MEVAEKLVCPKCQGQLAIWFEMATEYSRKIHPKTGEIKTRISKSEPERTERQGIKCTECEWLESLTTLAKKQLKLSIRLKLILMTLLTRIRIKIHGA